MTVAVAVRKGGRTILGADSLVNFGGQRLPPENCQFHKIVRVGDSALVWAGWSLYSEMLTAHLAKNTPPRLNSEAEVFNFFVLFWKGMRDEYTFTSRSMGDGDQPPFVSLDSTFLLVNKAGMFRVSGDMDVTQFEQYGAVGTGSKYALGALRVLYPQGVDAAEIAKRAIQVGIDFDVYCGGPIELVEF